MSFPVRYDDAMLATVETMWFAGQPLRAIAAEVGRSTSWVSHTARRQGWGSRGKGWPRGMGHIERADAGRAAPPEPVVTVRCPDCLARYTTENPRTTAHAGCTRNARLIATSDAASFAACDPNIYPEITE